MIQDGRKDVNVMLGPISKKALRSAWMLWERGFGALSNWRSLHSYQYGICKVFVKKHRGRTIPCEDGTIICHGDSIIELHLDNSQVIKQLDAVSSERAALRIARMLHHSLKEINDELNKKEEFSQVKALVGITLLHRGITHGLGFERHKLHSKIFEWTTTQYLRLLLTVLHPDGTERIERWRKQLVPVMLVHSRNSLNKQFASVSNVKFST